MVCTMCGGGSTRTTSMRASASSRQTSSAQAHAHKKYTKNIYIYIHIHVCIYTQIALTQTFRLATRFEVLDRKVSSLQGILAQNCSLQFLLPISKDPSSRIGNKRNTVSRVLFQKRVLTEFCAKLSEFCEKLGEFELAHKPRKSGRISKIGLMTLYAKVNQCRPCSFNCKAVPPNSPKFAKCPPTFAEFRQISTKLAKELCFTKGLQL